MLHWYCAFCQRSDLVGAAVRMYVALIRCCVLALWSGGCCCQHVCCIDTVLCVSALIWWVLLSAFCCIDMVLCVSALIWRVLLSACLLHCLWMWSSDIVCLLQLQWFSTDLHNILHVRRSETYKTQFVTQDSHMTVKCALQGLCSVFQNVHRTLCDSTVKFKLSNWPHTRSNNLHNTGCCADCLIVYGVVCLCNSLTIFKQVWILLCNSQVVQQFEACMDMFASCCTTSPVHHWSSYRSHLIFKMSHTTSNKEFWQEFIQLYRSLPTN